MAKKRRKRAGSRRRTRTRTITKTRYRTRSVGRRRRGGRRRHGGSSYALVPPKHELMEMAGAAGWGLLERMAKADAGFILNKVPKPIAAIGYTGNVALFLRAANHFFIRNPTLAIGIKAVQGIAAYQLARNGGLFTDATAVPTIAGEDDDIAGELDEGMMGALAAEGEGIFGDDDDISGDDDDVAGDEELPVLGIDEED